MASIRSLAGAGRLKVHAFKLPHHGSRNNVSRELIEAVDCDRYLFSTNGSQFHHPHGEAVARVLKFGRGQPELVFNYRSDETSIWDVASLKNKHGYTTRFPSSSENGSIEIDV